MSETTALYRHFSRTGLLLYVGISNDVLYRTEQHSTTAPWFLDISRIEVEWFGARREALDEETVAIIREKPLWNVRRNGYDVPRKDYRFCVELIGSRLWDGWYTKLRDAEDMLIALRSDWPTLNFGLVVTDDPWGDDGSRPAKDPSRRYALTEANLLPFVERSPEVA